MANGGKVGFVKASSGKHAAWLPSLGWIMNSPETGPSVDRLPLEDTLDLDAVDGHVTSGQRVPSMGIHGSKPWVRECCARLEISHG